MISISQTIVITYPDISELRTTHPEADFNLIKTGTTINALNASFELYLLDTKINRLNVKPCRISFKQLFRDLIKPLASNRLFFYELSLRLFANTIIWFEQGEAPFAS